MMDYNLVIFLVILGAAAVALCAYAVARVWGNFEPAPMDRFSDEQLAYMREVRARNTDYLSWMLRRNSKPEVGHSSTSFVVRAQSIIIVGCITNMSSNQCGPQCPVEEIGLAKML
jgi:hypothetical protein